MSMRPIDDPLHTPRTPPAANAEYRYIPPIFTPLLHGLEQPRAHPEKSIEERLDEIFVALSAIQMKLDEIDRKLELIDR